jgi:hypothetical protein
VGTRPSQQAARPWGGLHPVVAIYATFLNRRQWASAHRPVFVAGDVFYADREAAGEFPLGVTMLTLTDSHLPGTVPSELLPPRPCETIMSTLTRAAAYTVRIAAVTGYLRRSERFLSGS